MNNDKRKAEDDALQWIDDGVSKKEMLNEIYYRKQWKRFFLSFFLNIFCCCSFALLLTSSHHHHLLLIACYFHNASYTFLTSQLCCLLLASSATSSLGIFFCMFAYFLSFNRKRNKNCFIEHTYNNFFFTVFIYSFTVQCVLLFMLLAACCCFRYSCFVILVFHFFFANKISNVQIITRNVFLSYEFVSDFGFQKAMISYCNITSTIRSLMLFIFLVFFLLFIRASC